ncbi:MAG: 5-formyltetrahydrofolate cyclo-ligase [Planctomycetota bacterium]|nr:MAG: 5-formyltetrahydrofolate cyclo-ligase [Planctomycetota bacterium]
MPLNTSNHLPTPDASKSAFRAWARQVSKSQADHTAAISGQICANIAAILRDHAAKHSDLNKCRIMVYMPIRGEIDPIMLASWAISSGWEVCVGWGSSRSSLLQPVAIDPACMAGDTWHRDQCEPDAWDMAVPRAHVPVRTATLTAVVVPGLAFDRHGHRLGRGAGVYDRFLATLAPHTLRIGVIPNAQLVDALPTEPHDVPMHFVTTEQQTIAATTPAP